MMDRDQKLLEEAYKKIWENKHDPEQLVEPDPGWTKLPKDDKSRKNPCICNSGVPFNKCCGKRLEIGDIAHVMTQEECHWANHSKMKDYYQKQWNKIAGKCGIIVGCKRVQHKKMYDAPDSPNGFIELIYGIKDVSGKIYEINHELLDHPSAEEAKHYHERAGLVKDFPEIEGIF